jgi:N-acetylglucosaminyldiphosphoundecaprenol N-acetyl-beta-D-mannosaminyltransferase
MSNAQPAVASGTFEHRAPLTAEPAKGPLVFGIRFSGLDRAALTKLLVTPLPPGSGVRLVATANIDHIIHLRHNERFRDAYASAFAATADGAPIAIYARLRGVRIPGRVPGPDLFVSLIHAMRAGQHRPFFLVSNTRTGDLLKAWLQGRGFDPEAIACECPPFGFEKDREGSARLAQLIRDHGTTHLVMGVGAPKSEVWINEWRDHLGDCYAFGIGAGVDFFVGTAKRAPAWMRRIGFEWLWRLLSEPRRLGRRYFIDTVQFPVAILDDLSGSWPVGDRGRASA